MVAKLSVEEAEYKVRLEKLERIVEALSHRQTSVSYNHVQISSQEQLEEIKSKIIDVEFRKSIVS